MIGIRQIAPMLSSVAAAFVLLGTASAAPLVIRADGAGVDGGNPAVSGSCMGTGLCIASNPVATARANFESGASSPGNVMVGGARETFDGQTPTDVNTLDYAVNLAPTISVLGSGSVAASQHSGTGFWGALIDKDETGSPLLVGSGQAGRFSTNRTASQGTVTDNQAWVEFWYDLTIDLGAQYEAAGFDIADLGDVNGMGLKVLISSDNHTFTDLGAVSDTTGSSRKLSFFGIYSDNAAFRYIKLQLTVDQSNDDISDIDLIGLDNIFVGNLERRTTGVNLPEPGSLALLGLALVGGAVARRRRTAR